MKSKKVECKQTLALLLHGYRNCGVVGVKGKLQFA
jgi:hypothetical protein